jgi:hypothetical protein
MDKDESNTEFAIELAFNSKEEVPVGRKFAFRLYVFTVIFIFYGFNKLGSK